MPRLGFGGEVAELYARFRRGYPPGVVDTVAGHFGLTRADVVVDLGCGTGQLALPICQRVGAVIGVDPEPDMLAQAGRAAEARDARNLLWILGSDRDMPALGRVLGPGALGAVVIGQALHWMEPESLFGVLVDGVRPGGGVAVITDGTPLWLAGERVVCGPAGVPADVVRMDAGRDVRHRRPARRATTGS